MHDLDIQFGSLPFQPPAWLGSKQKGSLERFGFRELTNSGRQIDGLGFLMLMAVPLEVVDLPQPRPC